MAAIATREQERKALEQIKKIVEALGPDSYIGTAFDGVFCVAEYNINNDAACSLRDRAAIFAREQALTETAEKIKKLEAQLADTTAKLEREQEWRPYADVRNVSEEEYQKLATTCSVKHLSDEEAAELIRNEFGFDIDKIEIVHTVDVYEVNRHNALRKVGELKRDPLYDATDWNYIRFNVCGWSYEMQDGNLRLYR